MVRLLEYQGKEILKEYGIDVPRGKVIKGPVEAENSFKKLNKPAVLKAQILSKSRLADELIRFVYSADKAKEEASKLLGTKIRDFVIDKVLIEEKIDFNHEMYLSININDSYTVKGPEILFSKTGGENIEKLAEENPEDILKIPFDYLDGPDKYTLEDMFRTLEPDIISKLINIIRTLTKIFKDYDAKVVEINPLVYTPDKRLIALDCKLVIDDASVFKHKEFLFSIPYDMNRPPTQLERIAWKIEENDYRGTSYFIQLHHDIPQNKRKGYIAFHGIGGGASMLAADAFIKRGLKLANYADSSGNPPASKIYRLIKVILSQPGIEGYVLMGAVYASQEQWHHAHAVVKAFKEMLNSKPGFPVTILIAGNKEKESLEILKKQLKGLPIRLELYGRNYIYNVDFIAKRMIDMVKEYRKSLQGDIDG